MSVIKESSNESRARHALSLLAIHARSDTLERLHRAIEREITASSKTISRVAKSGKEDYIDAITEEECLAVEELLGLAFVAAQSFITLIRTELIVVSKVHLRYLKSPLSFAGNNGYDAFKLAPAMVGRKCSVVETINAIANYWKHSEEWPVIVNKLGGRLREAWDLPTLKNKGRSAEIVSDLGLAPNSAGNLRKAARAVGVKELDDLSPIRQTLSKWAEDVLKKARTEFGVKP